MGSFRALVTGPLVSTLHLPRGRVRMRVRRAALSVSARSRDVMRRTLRVVLESSINELSSSPAFHRLVDEVVQYLVHHPDVEALIHEQTTSFVEEAVDDLRSEAARGDTAVDRAMLALRRRVTRRKS
jgi:hypothetical protein